MATKKTVRKSINNKSNSEIKSPKAIPSTVPFLQRLVIILLIGTTVFLLVKKFGKYIIVGMVDNRPITRWELNRVMDDRYGKSTTDELVNRKILSQIAKKENISVSDQEVNDEVTKLKANLGGMAVDEAQIRDGAFIKLLITKIAQKKLDLSVSDDDIKQYFEENKDYFKDKKLDQVKDDIKETLQQLKLQQKFSEWFKEEKTKVKVLLFE